jgi:DNA mismatch repair ATPase MutS
VRDLLEVALTYAEPLGKMADALATLDCLAAFAALSAERRLCEPEMREEGRALSFRGLRNLLVEMDVSADRYVSSDLNVPRDRSAECAAAGAGFIISGPNMGGNF